MHARMISFSARSLASVLSAAEFNIGALSYQSLLVLIAFSPCTNLYLARGTAGTSLPVYDGK